MKDTRLRWMKPSDTLPGDYIWAREMAAKKQIAFDKSEGELIRQWRRVARYRSRGWTRESYNRHKRETFWRDVCRITNRRIMPKLVDSIFDSNPVLLKFAKNSESKQA